jgi:LysM repeat protein
MPRDHSHLRRTVAGLVLGLAAATLVTAPAHADHADHEPLPAGRRAVSYVVEPGDTASGLASRFHAWTAELISYNHLGPRGSLRVGQRLVIPVVVKGSRGGGRTAMWQHPDRDREKVRRVIAGAARHHGVDAQLALAIAWQESGWQMGVVSDARAIGAMQVLPSTGRWMEHYAGRRLDLRRLGDNAKAGVLLLHVLARHTHRRTHKIGAYYQGLGAVQRHGLYQETRAYVDDVEAIKRRLEDGRPPA